jgi:hypothetical protein
MAWRRNLSQFPVKAHSRLSIKTNIVKTITMLRKRGRHACQANLSRTSS